MILGVGPRYNRWNSNSATKVLAAKTLVASDGPAPDEEIAFQMRLTADRPRLDRDVSNLAFALEKTPRHDA